ncbi:MAG: VTT domain-containing protein [Acidimicrobiales bacterium]|nr:VTT domain-containing protein [Acidimicrobiales bacterium]
MTSHVIVSAVIAAGGLDPESLLQSFGALGLFLIIFAESGLFFGFFLPGDSLLFTAGLLSSQDKLPALPILLVGCFIAAVAGDQVGYLFGRKVGPALFRRPDSRIFKQEYIERSQEFFERHGSKTIVLARFVPVVRTFAPIVAGVGKMRYRTFVTYNVIGALMWAVGITTLGYVLGDRVPWVEENLELAIFAIIGLSLIPVLIEVIRARREPTPTPEELLENEEEIFGPEVPTD